MRRVPTACACGRVASAHTYRSTLIALLVCVAVWRPDALHAQGAWQSIGPTNIGGPVTSILVDPADANTLLISVDGGGIWRSTNGGSTWQVVNDQLPSLAVL